MPRSTWFLAALLSVSSVFGTEIGLYVENDAWFTNGERPKPWHSVPCFRTDSAALAPILHRGGFIGEGLRQADGLHIRFYQTENK